eukprot:scaffold100098_cov39-Prasinocladus_malaysianus.AAC.1
MTPLAIEGLLLSLEIKNCMESQPKNSCSPFGASITSPTAEQGLKSTAGVWNQAYVEQQLVVWLGVALSAAVALTCAAAFAVSYFGPNKDTTDPENQTECTTDLDVHTGFIGLAPIQSQEVPAQGDNIPYQPAHTTEIGSPEVTSPNNARPLCTRRASDLSGVSGELSMLHETSPSGFANGMTASDPQMSGSPGFARRYTSVEITGLRPSYWAEQQPQQPSTRQSRLVLPQTSRLPKRRPSVG